MLIPYIFGTHCILLVVVTSFASAIVEAFPQQRHLAGINNATDIMPNDDSNNVKTPFFNLSQQNNTKWVVPHFNFSHNDDITFCRNQQVIRVPVNRKSDIATIPCFTQYASFRNGTDILLYKGSPETKLTPISGNDTQQHRILGYITDSGFRYNFSGDWPKHETEIFERWRYTCLFANSSATNYVIVELYRDDNSAIISSRDCNPVYHVNDTGTFFCQIPGNVTTTDFEWAYRTEDGNDTVFHPRRKVKKNIYNGIVEEDVRLKLSKANIIGIVCRVSKNDSNSTFQGLLNISVQAKDIKVPVVLDNGTVELDDEPGLQLNCSFIADDSQSTHVQWLQDDSELNNTVQIIWSMPIRTTTLKGLKSIYPSTSTNYTCVVRNHLGLSSKSFIVTRKNPNLAYIYAVAIIISVLMLTLIIAYVEWKIRKNAVMTDYKNVLKLLKGKDPTNSCSIKFVKDSQKWIFLGRGVYGEVWKTEIVHPDSGEKQTVAVKTFTWPPFLSIKDVKLRFDDLINEIRICQELSGSRNIVRYVGFSAPEVHSFNVYLILDFCDPGQLEYFLYQHNQNHTFTDDIDTIGRKRIQSLQINGTLKTSHLMKLAQQIAEAMTTLHGKNIVHRDLASRNILLKKMNTHNNESIDDVYAQLADFGMSRFLGTCSDSYIIQEDIPKERNFPMFWYPPESIGFDSKVEYTKKSDVWSFGVLLWEMFSRGSNPNLSYGFKGDIKAENVRQELLNGRRLRKEYLYNTPEEIWLLMERCWSLVPEDRPDFSVISQTLKDINSSFGLYNVASTAKLLNQEVSNATEENDLRVVVNATVLLGDTNTSEATSQCQCAVEDIELTNLGVAVASATKSANFVITKGTDYVNHGALNTNGENKKWDDDGDGGHFKQQEQSTANQSMQNCDKVQLSMGKNAATSRNTYMQHGLQVEE